MRAVADGRSRRAESLRESRRAQILETAERVFAKKGYHQTRVSDILGEAKIARGTFYLYFDSKSAIFLELLEGLLRELRATVVGVEVGPEAPPVKTQLLGTVTRIVRAVEDHRDLTRIILREAVGLDAEADKKLREFYRNLHRFIGESLDNGRVLGIVRDLDTEVVASCILGSIKYLLEQRLMDATDDQLDPERIAHAVLEYNLRGLLI